MEEDDLVRGNWLREDASSSKEMEPGPSGILEELVAGSPDCVRLRSAQQHGIFLSHSGAQKPFVRRLRDALVRNAYCPFFDEDPECLPKGEFFAPQIKTACQLTDVAVVVLSDEFFTSKWPMIELSIFIREQKRREGSGCMKIFPLFMGFSVKEFRNTERQEYWQNKWNELRFGNDEIGVLKEALKVLGGINGLEYCRYKNEEEYIEIFMSEIFKLVSPDVKWDDSDVKGKSKFRQAVGEMFARSPPNARFRDIRAIGLYGVGGIGKTTLCKSLCNDYRHKFNGKVWHAALGENTAEEIQKDVLRHLVGTSEALLKRNCKDQLRSLLCKRIGYKVFLAIDNVWNEDISRRQAEILLDMGFHPDSLVIVTSRSCEVLEWLGIPKECCFEMPLLDKIDATEVLLQSVKRGFDIESAKDYQRIAIETVVERCFMTKGPISSAGSEKQYIPLALEVLGKQLRLPLLRDTSMQLKKWVDDLDLKRSDQEKHPIFSVLRLSYDKLPSPKHKSIFIDVALYVPRQHDNTSASVIEVCKWLSMVHGENFDTILRILDDLEKYGLVENWHLDTTSPFGMHELYCEFAKMEVAEADDLEKQRYLYHEGESDMPALMRWTPVHNYLPLRRIHISSGVFRELSEEELHYMVNVEVLKLDFCFDLESLDVRCLKRLRSVELRECFSLQIVNGLEHLKYLKYFRWSTCRNPLVIADFPQALEVLEIYGSKESESLNIGSFGDCVRLLELTLSYHPMLAAVPDLLKLHKLEKVDFSGCCKVDSVSGLGGLINLRHLILENCKGLRHCDGLEKLVRVQTLNLRGCVSLQLPAVWDLNRLVSLRSINIGSIQVVQKLVLGSPHLEELEVKGCGYLRTVTLSNNCGSWRFLNWLNERWMGNPVESPKWILDCQGSGAVQSQTVDDHIGKFIWTIPNFRKIATRKYYSYPFVVGGYNWRVLLFPSGNNVDQLSLYLDVADCSQLPYGWTRFVHFNLTVINQYEPQMSVRKGTLHHFNGRESDWGFTSFMPLHELDDPSKGFLVNDTLVIEADVNAPKMVDYHLYDSKKETGFVGLKNQGGTGYLNILLQTLYHIPYFRKAVYHMPTAESAALDSSIPLALQSVFFNMQHSDTRVSTKDLEKSYISSTPHDIWELNRVLLDKLKILMKGTVVEGTIQGLFEGQIMKYVECINVDYKSTQKESFYGLELDVKGCKNIYESFDKYVEIERMDWFRAHYDALQDAKRRVLFIEFPPVLELRLKHYEFDDTLDSMAEINDRCKCPLQLDLDRDNGKYLSPNADRHVRNLYTLHSVLVHDAHIKGGHYYSFIRPTLTEQWYKFDEEHVTKVDIKRALNHQFGGEDGDSTRPQNSGFKATPFKSTKCLNVYALVYIRDSDKDKVICHMDEKDIAEHLQIRLKKEQGEKERKRKYKAEARLYTVIRIARDGDLSDQIGKHLFFDLIDHGAVKGYRIQKEVPFKQFKEEVAKDTGIPVNCQRFWFWARRQNRTYRPHRPLTDQEEMETVGELKMSFNDICHSVLNLWLEVNPSVQDRIPVPVPERTEEDVLLFFKLYLPEKEELRFAGRLFVKAVGKPLDIFEKLNEMAGFPENEEISMYEEVKFETSVMCEKIDKESTFRGSELENGDIICYQKSFTKEETENFRYPDVPSFLEYVWNRQIVHFRRLEKPKDDEFCIELSKLHTYDDVVDKVAQKLGVEDPSKVRLTSHSCYLQRPMPQPITYRGVERLIDMLVRLNQTSDILYFEILDLSRPELQGLESLKISYHNSKTEKVSAHNIRLPLGSTIGDVINDLKTKVELSSPMADLRIVEIFYHKIYKVLPLNEKIENLNDPYWTLRAEEVPDEEKDVAGQYRVIHVYHFLRDSLHKKMVQNFGEPFFLVLKKNETLAAVKARIQNKLQVVDEDFSQSSGHLTVPGRFTVSLPYSVANEFQDCLGRFKYKFAIVSRNQPIYLQDDDVVANFFQKKYIRPSLYGGWEHYLGLEHTDSASKQTRNEPEYVDAQTIKRARIWRRYRNSHVAKVVVAKLPN